MSFRYNETIRNISNSIILLAVITVAVFIYQDIFSTVDNFLLELFYYFSVLGVLLYISFNLWMDEAIALFRRKTMYYDLFDSTRRIKIFCINDTVFIEAVDRLSAITYFEKEEMLCYSCREVAYDRESYWQNISFGELTTLLTRKQLCSGVTCSSTILQWDTSDSRLYINITWQEYLKDSSNDILDLPNILAVADYSSGKIIFEEQLW